MDNRNKEHYFTNNGHELKKYYDYDYIIYCWCCGWSSPEWELNANPEMYEYRRTESCNAKPCDICGLTNLAQTLVNKNNYPMMSSLHHYDPFGEGAKSQGSHINLQPDGVNSSNAIPAEAIPSNAIPAEAIPAEAIPAEAIPSNAIPAEALPAEAIPAEAIPAEAIPSNAIPAEAIPAEAIPSNAIPAEAIPSNAIPAEAIPAEGLSIGRLNLKKSKETDQGEAAQPQDSQSDGITSDELSDEDKAKNLRNNLKDLRKKKK